MSSLREFKAEMMKAKKARKTRIKETNEAREVLLQNGFKLPSIFTAEIILISNQNLVLQVLWFPV